MNELHYWVLERVVDCRNFVGHLLFEDREGFFNVSCPSRDAREIAEAIVALFKGGLIFLGENDRVRPPDDPADDLLHRIRAIDGPGLGPPSGMLYGLTDRGGEAWEDLSAPDWSRYVDEVYPEYEEYLESGGTRVVAKISGTDRAYVEEYVELLARRSYWNVKRVQQTRMVPWSATYWKKLPEGWQFCLRATAPPERPPTVDEVMDMALHPERKAYQEACESGERLEAMQKWYTRPALPNADQA